MHEEYRTSAELEAEMRAPRITDRQKVRLLHVQDYRCAICQRAGVRLYLDHDHVTDLVRGYLCGSCNVRLGNHADSPRLLHESGYLEHAAYLRRPPAAEWGIEARYPTTTNVSRRVKERWRREALEELGWGVVRRHAE